MVSDGSPDPPRECHTPPVQSPHGPPGAVRPLPEQSRVVQVVRARVPVQRDRPPARAAVAMGDEGHAGAPRPRAALRGARSRAHARGRDHGARPRLHRDEHRSRPHRSRARRRGSAALPRRGRGARAPVLQARRPDCSQPDRPRAAAVRRGRGHDDARGDRSSRSRRRRRARRHRLQDGPSAAAPPTSRGGSRASTSTRCSASESSVAALLGCSCCT